jgi:hypothetical protein
MLYFPGKLVNYDYMHILVCVIHKSYEYSKNICVMDKPYEYSKNICEIDNK